MNFSPSEHGPFAVRQISGLIARKIICPLAEGEELERGSRMGMIKFGSRTELLVPADADVEVLVKIGDNVRGGATQLLRYRVFGSTADAVEAVSEQ